MNSRGSGSDRNCIDLVGAKRFLCLNQGNPVASARFNQAARHPAQKRPISRRRLKCNQACERLVRGVAGEVKDYLDRPWFGVNHARFAASDGLRLRMCSKESFQWDR